MSGGDQFLDGGKANKSGGAGNENTHDLLSRFAWETNLGAETILVK